ncbi:MAG: hypothetical protein KC656_26640, partial [Myxococcales bacterium]|nr:hypothetical protein [Myxococcales bacterium]
MNPVEDPVVRNVRLALHHGGPQSSAELAARTGASVSTVQRALRSLDVLTMGRARATRHALRREIRGVDPPVALYEVTTAPRRLGDLHPAHPYGFGFVASVAWERSRWFDDLPWFLHDLRPSGYLGRQVPLRHPELDVPRDVLVWSGDDVLRWATDARHDGIGAFVLGEASLARLAAEAVHPPASLCRDDRLEAYATLAEAALQLGPVGSSAAGEQPKLLARVEGRSVIVKISPPRTGGELAVRVADLLVAE